MPHRALPVLAAFVLATSGLLAGCGTAGPVTVEIQIHYSAFVPTAISVPHGVPVTFVLVNDDPIDHEWLVGDEAFHERHRTGTEHHHGAVPEEVSIVALSTQETTITFPDPGTLTYVCHLPGHEAYGMTGMLTIT
ncbi:MAG: plastocyanin/azurin family copper-binding protein [Chloroflexota bacterium]